jgi:hypothetical protein
MSVKRKKTMAAQGLDLSSFVEEQSYPSIEALTDTGSGRSASTEVPMNSLLEETNQLQEAITVLESHPSLEKLLDAQLQQRLHTISKRYARFIALATACGFIVGALIATCIVIFLGIH